MKMSEFEKELLEFVGKFKDLQNDENIIGARAHMITGQFQDFLKRNGLPEKFTMAEALHLAISKSRL